MQYTTAKTPHNSQFLDAQSPTHQQLKTVNKTLKIIANISESTSHTTTISLYLEDQTNNSSPSLEKRRRLQAFFHQHIVPSTQIEAESPFRRNVNINFRHFFRFFKPVTSKLNSNFNLI